MGVHGEEVAGRVEDGKGGLGVGDRVRPSHFVGNQVNEQINVSLPFLQFEELSLEGTSRSLPYCPTPGVESWTTDRSSMGVGTRWRYGV